MIDWVQRKTVAAVAMTAALALSGCTSSGGTPFDHGNRSPGPPNLGVKPAQGAPGPVVDGVCPKVSMREGTAFLRKYQGGAKDDPSKLIVQASLADTTRQCSQNEQGQLTVTVMAQGRLVLGPAGKGGSFSLPIRVAVIDGENTVYSQLVKLDAQLPPGQPSGQFLFSKNDVTLPPGIGATSTVFLGFDEGPYNTQ